MLAFFITEKHSPSGFETGQRSVEQKVSTCIVNCILRNIGNCPLTFAFLASIEIVAILIVHDLYNALCALQN